MSKLSSSTASVQCWVFCFIASCSVKSVAVFVPCLLIVLLIEAPVHCPVKYLLHFAIKAGTGMLMSPNLKKWRSLTLRPKSLLCAVANFQKYLVSGIACYINMLVKWITVCDLRQTDFDSHHKQRWLHFASLALEVVFFHSVGDIFPPMFCCRCHLSYQGCESTEQPCAGRQGRQQEPWSCGGNAEKQDTENVSSATKDSRWESVVDYQSLTSNQEQT